MDMSSLHNGGTRWHFLGCRTLNQRDQQYVECQHGDIWFPFHSSGITAGMPADITVLPKLALGLSDFSFHFNVFRNNTCITALCDAPAPTWYFDYLCERFDLTKAIWCQWHLASASGDRQVKEARQQIGPGGDRERGREGCLRLFSGCGAAGLDTSLTHLLAWRWTTPGSHHSILSLMPATLQGWSAILPV